MTPLEAAEKLSVPAPDLWRGFLCDMWRSNAAKAGGMPVGTMQFEIVGADASRTFFSVTLSDGGATSERGVAMDSIAWIEAQESAVREMLDGEATTSKLTVTGDHAFVTRAFKSLGARAATTSVLGARLSK